MAHDWSEYQRGYDHSRMFFTKKDAAKNLAAYLAAELGLRPASFSVEGMKGEFHLKFHFGAAYWSPKAPDLWDYELELFKKAARRAMQ